MDQPLSIPPSSHLSHAAPDRTAASGSHASLDGGAVPAEEEPESPGRTSRAPHGAAPASDPLAEGFGLIGGVCIALLTLLVPLATVVAEHRAPASGETTAAGW